MEKKPNITPTPWIKPTLMTECGNGTIVVRTTIQEMRKAETAVNCTYGANINPEKIQELIDKTNALIKEVEFSCAIGSDPRLLELLKRRTETIDALNNIKYKD